jgi:GNAT superfamily N-acetyltransferase
VTVGDDDEAIGYLLVDEIDGAAHIEQVSVTPDYQGQGLGRELIERVRAWATTRGMTALTLTTFGHIPWNRPLYEHLGFRVLSGERSAPGCGRCAMRRPSTAWIRISESSCAWT